MNGSLPRASSATVAVLLAALVGAGGCGDDVTGVLVRIEPEDATLGGKIDGLTVVAVGREAGDVASDPVTRPYEPTGGGWTWPQSVAVLAGPRASVGVDVLVIGLQEGIEVARGGAVVAFAPGRVADATVTLRAACRGVYCAERSFCGAAGQCEPDSRRHDFTVNAAGPGDQTSPVVASLGETGWVVAWVNGADGRIHMRRLQPDGVRLDDTDVPIDASSGVPQTSPVLAVAPQADTFVVGWAAGESSRVRVRRFRATSLAALDEQSQAPAGTGVGAQVAPALGANPSGFIVAWQDSEAATAPGPSIRFRRGKWDAGWLDLSAAYAATSPAGAEQLPAACGSCGGTETFLVAWQDTSMADPDPSGIQIRGRWLAGTPAAGGESVLDTTTAGDQVTPAAASGTTMGVIVWEDRGPAPPAIRARICGPGSSYLTPELTPAFASASLLAARPAVGVAGDVALVVWEAEPADAPGTIVVLGQRLHQSGVPVDDAFPVAPRRSGNQQQPRVAGSDKDFAIVWHEYDPGGAGWEIRGRILGAAEVPW